MIAGLRRMGTEWPADDAVEVAIDSVETAYKGFLTVEHYCGMGSNP